MATKTIWNNMLNEKKTTETPWYEPTPGGWVDKHLNPPVAPAEKLTEEQKRKAIEDMEKTQS